MELDFCMWDLVLEPGRLLCRLLALDRCSPVDRSPASDDGSSVGRELQSGDQRSVPPS